jgi:hypothetical protein
MGRWRDCASRDHRSRSLGGNAPSRNYWSDGVDAESTTNPETTAPSSTAHEGQNEMSDDHAFPQHLVRGLGAGPSWVFNRQYWVYVGTETNRGAPLGRPTAFSADGSVGQGHWVTGMLAPPGSLVPPETPGSSPIVWLWYPMPGQTIDVNGRQVTSGSGESGYGLTAVIDGGARLADVPGFTQTMNDYWVKEPKPKPPPPPLPGGGGTKAR